MKKSSVALLLAFALLFAIPSGFADSFPEIPEEDLLDALKSSMPNYHYPNCEFIGAGYYFLGQETKGLTRRVFMAASVGGYGFLGDAFVMQSGWGGPCTAVFVLRQGRWRFKELLEVESWNDVHTIMPASAIKKWKSLDNDTWVQEVIARQVSEYLDSIGRTERIAEVGDMGFGLSNMLVYASNFLSFVDYAYPLYTTTRERLDRRDGERYLYTRAWEPDPDGPIDATIQSKLGSVALQGGPGTQTLTKTRKSDGKVLETILMKVEMERLTIILKDEGGSATYVLPFDSWELTYKKPVITREGTCRVNTIGLDRNIEDLPGEKQSTPVIEAQTLVRDFERFTVFKDSSLNTLVYSRLNNGQWDEVWRNDKLLPRTNQEIYLIAHPREEPSLHEMTRYSTLRLSGLSIYAGEEHPDLAIDLFVNEQDVWEVDSYSWNGNSHYADLFPDGMFINDGDFSATSVGGFQFAAVNQNAGTFDAMSIDDFKNALNDLTQGAPDLPVSFLGVEEMTINLKADARLPVYLTSDLKEVALGGKAAVSLKDWVMILAKDGKAMCVLYETKDDHFRVGWVDASLNSQLNRLLDLTIKAQFIEDAHGFTLRKTTLFDDPLNLSGTVLTLKKGEELRVLFEGQDALYVEVKRQGKLIWGFVLVEDVQLNEPL